MLVIVCLFAAVVVVVLLVFLPYAQKYIVSVLFLKWLIY